MERYCLTLDLVDDAGLIKEYEKWHQQIWPEISSSIKDSGIEMMEIYRFSNRLMMIMEVNGAFSFEKKNKMDQANARVQDWEQLMWKYQQAVPGAKPGEKWVLMSRIFQL